MMITEQKPGLVDVMDRLSKVTNLLMLIQIATEGIKTKETNALSEAACIALDTLDVCVNQLQHIQGKRA